VLLRLELAEQRQREEQEAVSTAAQHAKLQNPWQHEQVARRAAIEGTDQLPPFLHLGVCASNRWRPQARGGEAPTCIRPFY